MESIDGPFERFPLGCILFLAQRCASTGRLRLGLGERIAIVHLKDGQVCEAKWVPGLFAGLDPALDELTELSAGLAAAVQGGTPLAAAQETAARNLGAFLARSAERVAGAMISYLPDAPAPAGAFPLPLTLVQMFNFGLRRTGSVQRMRARLARQGEDPVHALMPQNVDLPRLGLDAMALRVLNLTGKQLCLDDLVMQATGRNTARRPEVLHRADLLFQLGLLQQPQPSASSKIPEKAVEAAPARTQAPPATERKRKDRKQHAEHAAKSAKLRRQAENMREQNHYERLGLQAATRQPTAQMIDAALREQSRKFHPDMHIEASPDVQKQAANCFAMLQESVEALQNSAVAEEHWERADCARRGVPYVSDRDRTRARVAFKKGERLFRSKEYDIAEACYHEAMRRDPLTPEYAHQHAYTAYLARQLQPAEAISVLDGLKPPTQVEAARYQVTCGRILQLSSAPKARAMERFTRAVELDETNHEAQRELRLHAMRKPKKEEPASRWSLLTRFRKKDDEG